MKNLSTILILALAVSASAQTKPVTSGKPLNADFASPAPACNLGNLVRAADAHLKIEHPDPETYTVRSSVNPYGSLWSDSCEPQYSGTLAIGCTWGPCLPSPPSAESLRIKAKCLIEVAEAKETDARAYIEREAAKAKAEQAFRDELSKCKPVLNLKGASK